MDRSRLVKVGLLFLALILIISMGLHFYSDRKSVHVKRIMKVVYKHEPNFNKIIDGIKCPRITRVMQSGDKWLAYNTFDFNKECARHVLDGERFMLIKGEKVEKYQHGPVSIDFVNDFFCIGFIKRKHSKKFWIFDETGKRTGCIDDSQFHQPYYK